MQDTQTSMLFFMLTDILKESTRLLFVGKEAKQVVENAFRQEAQEHFIDIEGMVSRKKQLIPQISTGIQ